MKVTPLTWLQVLEHIKNLDARGIYLIIPGKSLLCISKVSINTLFEYNRSGAFIKLEDDADGRSEE